ncbi:MAG TPA: alpha/beta fold hydrolase, partial [Rhodobacteraceae bacterium]|nr:alpha/beta fold hydrolase [Paracoccaceae bacterium]
MNGTEEDHVVVDGTRVTFRAAGSGPPVVLIHGSGNGDGRDWQFSVFDELARNNRVVAFDRPGIGGSEAIAGGDGPRAQARHLARATAQLDLQAPLLAGHSYGGAVGLAWALGDGAIPAQVAPRGLMLLAAITHTPPPPPAIFRMLARSVISGPMAWLVCHPMRAGALKSLLSQTFAPQEP